MTYSQHVAANIRAEIARQQKTTRELEQLLNMSTTSVRYRLNGQIPFSLDQTAEIARFLKINVVDLTTPDDKIPKAA